MEPGREPLSQNRPLIGYVWSFFGAGSLADHSEKSISVSLQVHRRSTAANAGAQ
jgi:hypothetical protein